jgi:hypothetical protein
MSHPNTVQLLSIAKYLTESNMHHILTKALANQAVMS